MAESSESAFGHSMTDLMTSLMVIFILLLVASLNNARAKTKNTRAKLVQELQQRLQTGAGEDAVRVELDPKDPLGLLIIPPRQLLNFAENASTLPAGAAPFLQNFVPRLVGVVCSNRFRAAVGSVAMEGHTDPSGGELLNLGLSQRRANAVAVASLAAVPSGAGRSCLEQLLSANGRGEADSEGLPRIDWARARQVIVKIRVRSSEEQELQSKLATR